MIFRTILLLLISSASLQAQTYYCPVLNAGGLTINVDQWFVVGDSSVITKAAFKGKTDSLRFKRVVSSNPSVIYFTDGVMTQSLMFMNTPGTIKGKRYTHMGLLKTDIQQAQPAAVCYCVILPKKE